MTDEKSPPESLRDLVAALRQPVALWPDLSERARHRGRRRTIRVAAALASAALAAAGIASLQHHARPDHGTTFALDAPKGRSVALVGDFTDWRTDRVQLVHEPSGRWQVTLKLPPGRYRFAYVVDNSEWHADASAAPALDDFGRPTSVITVAAR